LLLIGKENMVGEPLTMKKKYSPKNGLLIRNVDAHFFLRSSEQRKIASYVLRSKNAKS